MANEIIVFLLLLIILINFVYGEGGSWIKLEKEDFNKICVDLHMCTNGGYTRTEVFDLVGDALKSSEFDTSDVSQLICQKLVAKERKVIIVIGDSYMRHVFQAMVSLISGNLKDGPLKKNHNCIQKCQGTNQFFKQGCSSECLDFRHLLCGGLVQIHLIQHVPPSINYCLPGTSMLWSEGNHPVQGGKVYESTNASYLTQKFNSLSYGICAYLKNAENNDCNLFWVSSHQRLRKYSPDEDDELIMDFNNGMKKYFVNFQNCGSNTRYIDTFDFTQKLVNDLPKEAEGAAPDGIHWGLSVNLIKAVEIIIDLTKD